MIEKTKNIKNEPLPTNLALISWHHYIGSVFSEFSSQRIPAAMPQNARDLATTSSPTATTRVPRTRRTLTNVAGQQRARAPGAGLVVATPPGPPLETLPSVGALRDVDSVGRQRERPTPVAPCLRPPLPWPLPVATETTALTRDGEDKDIAYIPRVCSAIVVLLGV